MTASEPPSAGAQAGRAAPTPARPPASESAAAPSPPPPGRIRRLLQPVTVMLATLVILVGCVPFTAALALYILHSRSELREAQINAGKTATLLLRSFEQVVAPIDSLLQNYASSYDPAWSPTEVYGTLKGLSLPPSLVQLSVVDKHGAFIASNLSAPREETLDLSDREHIRVHMAANADPTRPLADALFISKPVLGRVSKAWTLQFTRPLKDKAGHFAGVVVASYVISDFINFYSQLRTDDDMLIALVGLDGVIRARAAAKTSFGGNVSETQAFKALKGISSTPYDFTSPIDGIERVGYVIRSQRYPIMVAVAYSLDFIRQQTRDFRTAIWGTALGLAAALFIIVLVFGRYANLQRELNIRALQARARHREANMLEAISRVPDISVMHVTPEGPNEIGAPSSGTLGRLMRAYLRSSRFRALAVGLKEPRLTREHLSDGTVEREVEVVVTPLMEIEAKAPAPPSEGAAGGPGSEAPQDVVVFAVDQTSRRMEENKLYQMSKLASLGEVATGLAHEINQPLGVIRLAAANALNGMKHGLPAAHLESKLQRIIQQTERMSRIIDHMRIFGRKSNDDLQPSRPLAAVEGALQVMGAQFHLDNIEITTRCATDVPEVLCRQDQLEQVLINLLQNARDAIYERRQAHPRPQEELEEEFVDRITISVGVEADAMGSPMVRFDVADNAGGIPEEVIDRIFQPFFTTKPPGKGTGLGLSVSFGIIRDHGGSLSVANDPDGAVFTIRLPGAPARQGARDLALEQP